MYDSKFTMNRWNLDNSVITVCNYLNWTELFSKTFGLPGAMSNLWICCSKSFNRCFVYWPSKQHTYDIFIHHSPHPSLSGTLKPVLLLWRPVYGVTTAANITPSHASLLHPSMCGANTTQHHPKLLNMLSKAKSPQTVSALLGTKPPTTWGVW